MVANFAMADFHLAVTTFLIVLLRNCTGETGNPGSRFYEVHVSLFGHDSDRCGSPRQPCRSLVQAVHQVDWGGIIYLNGTGSEQHPYNCSLHVTRDYHPGIYINKSMSMKNYFLPMPHVSCIGGFHFQNSPGNQEALRFELSGIIFQQTSLRFEDCSDVKILNCSFSDSSKAITVYIKKCTNFTLDIQRSSVFRNNSRCIQLFLFDDITIQDRYVEINAIDTYFLENGYHSKGLSEAGVITLTADVAKPMSRLHLTVFCYQVVGIGNRGSFINNNVATAVTKEVYKNVQLKQNQGIFETSTDFSHAKSNHLVGGLYSSQATKIFAQFIDVDCIHNTLLRCIAVTSDHAEIEIQSSRFRGQSVLSAYGGCISLESTGYVSLAIYNTTFTRNKAKAGGAISVNCPNGIVKLNFSNVNFSQCSSRKYGCAVSVGRTQHHSILSPDKLYANFSNVQVTHCNGTMSYNDCISVYLLLKSGAVKIEKSTWSENSQAASGALFVEARGGRVDVDISGCIFADNGPSKRGGAVISLLALGNHSGNATIMNTSFINKKERQNEAMNISATYRIKLVNLIAKYYWKGLNIALYTNGAVNIYIVNCKFINTMMDINIYLRDPTSVQLIIKNTILIGSRVTTKPSYAVRVVIPPLRKIRFSSAVIILKNNTFDSRPSSSFGLFFQGRKNVTIQHTTFRNCVCFHGKEWRKHLRWSKGLFYQTATGAISILTNPGSPLQLGCVQSDDNKDTHPLWSYDSHVLFEDTNFINNLGLLVGGVYLSNSNATFKRCTFEDNFASQLAGHVYSAFGNGQVNFEDCSFKRQKEGKKINKVLFDKAVFLNSESEGPVHFQNTTMVSSAADTDIYAFSVFEISNGGYVKIDDNSTIQCNRGYELQLENNTHFVYTERNKTDCRINVTALKYSCKLCSPGYYSLLKGVSHGALIDPTFRCLECPFGANCVKRNIAAKPNFWGYQVSKNPRASLKFCGCPEHYCNSPTSYSTQYNSCRGNRSGILCGECSPGYSETLFSTECRRRIECNGFWMWCLTICLLTTGFVLYLLVKPPVLNFLGRQLFWFRKSDEKEIRQSLGPVDVQSDKGFLKITFYFYQAADLLIVGSADHLLHKIPFIYAVVAAFNFEVRSLNNGIGCPFPGITAVTKELLLSVPVLVTMTEVVILFCAHFVFNTMRRRGRPSALHYMAVVLEILLLGYERLAETSFKLMHCVSISSEERLFVNAEILCWQWWQYILLAYIGVFVVPFVVVLYYGSSKLCEASISSREFFGACIFPLPFLVYWLLKKLLKKKKNTHGRIQSNKVVLEVLHGPFRQPSDNDTGTLYWESVLIARRLILLSCHSFIAIAMFRMVCMTIACLIMLLHHVLKNPYRDSIANKAETISLLALVMMAVINLTKATLHSFGTSTDGPAKPYLETLEWAEVCALAFVPMFLSIFIIFAIFSQLVRLMVTLGTTISRRTRWPRLPLRFTRELERPLLDITEED